MRKVFIKHNPYKIETEITIDGREVKTNSALNVGARRLQDWIEDLPRELVKECNTKTFEINFHGTILDYEDLVSVAEDAKNKGISIEYKHIPAKEVQDKEEAIKRIFKDIQKGPFNELKKPSIIEAFENASNKEFPVSVVATMSAGKSTLINALLGQKLMPAKQEACTATITEIKDNDNPNFQAKVYDTRGKLIEEHTELTLEIMNKLNSDSLVSTIKVEGNIPFVSSKDTALVLVDTPGPNNSRDENHKKATYRMLDESSKPVVLYIINATQLEVTDDSGLLNYIADIMKAGGKQSRDRFIFVINKLDEFKKDDDSVKKAIEKVRRYLEDKGIQNPNIFPASALTALDIRTTLIDHDMKTSLDDIEDMNILGVIAKLKKMNRNPDLYLEKYAPLPPSVKDKVNGMLAQAREADDTKQEALVHTGIISIEEAIKMYVEKYAKTAKIKNIVDTFAKQLESSRSFDETKKMIRENQEEKEEIVAKIETIEAKIKSGKEAKKFKTKIDAINYDKEIKNIANGVINKAQEKITPLLSSDCKKLSQSEAESLYQSFVRFSENLQAEIQFKLEDIITTHINKNAVELLEQYKQHISELADEIQVGEISINPFELISGEIGNIANPTALISGLIKSEEVKVGTEWQRNWSKKWYKPWTYFQGKGSYMDVYEDKEYVDESELAIRFFAPIQKQLYKNRDNAVEYAKRQSEEIKNAFSKKFKELDDILKVKLKDLKDCTTDRDDAEQKIKEIETRLNWLENIQSKIESILEI